MNPSAQIVIFGASGDLTRRMLMPALARLASRARAEREFSVVGVARRALGDEAFRGELAKAMPDDARDAFEALAPRVFYQPGDVADAASLAALRARLDALAGGPGGRLIYLALRPELFPAALRGLAAAGLLAMREGEHVAWRRVVIEKPFGSDLASARRLNEELHEVLREDQIYRIDHFLGKETVQNLLGFRFHNAIFEPLWNRHHVELVQISVAERIGVERGRAAFYEGTGALRDMLQNHMLQILALVAMEPPASLEPEAIRSQKVELLRGLHCPEPNEVGADCVRARYGPGRIGDERVVGYLDEEAVAPDSRTETYVALRAEIDNWRWSGVPFLLRHGKRLARRFSEVQVQFRTPPLQLFNRPDGMDPAEFRRRLRDGSLCQIRPNVLSLSIQPREAIRLSFGVKQPGSALRMAPATLDFDYREHFGEAPAPAYERLLLDALLGDQTLFLRADEIEASWRYADEVRAGWEGPDAPPLLEYPAGSWGPPEADALFHGCEGGWSRG